MTLELLHQDLSNHFYEYKGVTGGVFNRGNFILTSIVGIVDGIWQAYYMVMQYPSGAILGGSFSKVEALQSARTNITKFDDEGLRSHIEKAQQTQIELREKRQKLREEYIASSTFAAPEIADRPCSVYIIKVGSLYKIGQSLNPERRINSMTLPEAPETIRIFNVQKAQQLERALHKRFKKCREHGEWFSLTEEQISEIDRCVEIWKETARLAA